MNTNKKSNPIKQAFLALSLVLTLGVTTPALARGAGQEWEKIQNEIAKLNKPSDMEQAIKLAKKALSLAEKNADNNHPDIALSLLQLSKFYLFEDENRSSLLVKRAWVIIQNNLDNDTLDAQQSFDIATYISRLVILYEFIGKKKDARALLTKANSVVERILINNDLDENLSFELAISLHAVKEYDKAFDLYKHAFKLTKASSSYNTDDLLKLGLIHESLSRYEKALIIYHQALTKSQRTHGENHLVTVNILSEIAGCHNSQKKYKTALKLYNQVLKKTEKTFGKEHLETAKILNHIAGIHEELSHKQKALDSYQRVLTIKEKNFGKKHPELIPTLIKISGVHVSMGQFQKELDVMAKISSIKRPEPEQKAVSDILFEFGRSDLMSGHFKKAFNYFNHSYGINLLMRGRNHSKTISAKTMRD